MIGAGNSGNFAAQTLLSQQAVSSCVGEAHATPCTKSLWPSRTLNLGVHPTRGEGKCGRYHHPCESATDLVAPVTWSCTLTDRSSDTLASKPAGGHNLLRKPTPSARREDIMRLPRACAPPAAHASAVTRPVWLVNVASGAAAAAARVRASYTRTDPSTWPAARGMSGHPGAPGPPGPTRLSPHQAPATAAWRARRPPPPKRRGGARAWARHCSAARPTWQRARRRPPSQTRARRRAGAPPLHGGTPAR